MERLQATLACRLTLVSAQAGYGKSTVLAQWISESRPSGRVAWVSLDEGDNDPVRFWDYFIAALKTIKPAIGQTSLALLHSPQPCPAESVLTALINDLTDMDDDFAVVLDDYHLIHAEPVHSSVVFLLERMPLKMHLVIGTRADPPLHLSRLRGRSQMEEIGADDLRFTLEETTELFRETQRLVLSEEDATALNACTEGWAVGLKMAGLSMRGQKDIRKFLASFTGSQRYVMDYLTEELLKQQPAEIRDFFLKTSVLDRLTGPLSDYLTGHKGGGELLIGLDSAFGGFLIPLDESRQWYRYHHLLAELLRHQLERASGAEEVTRLHRRASQWYEDNQFPDDAVHHALAAQDWERAMRLVYAESGERTKRGEWNTLSSWLQRIPDEALRTHRRLYSQYANTLVTLGQAEAAKAVLAHLDKTSQDDARLQGEVALFQADIARRKSDSPAAIKLSRKALSLLPMNDLSARARARLTLGLAQTQTDIQEKRSSLADAVEEARAAGDRWTATVAASTLGWFLWEQGRLSEGLAMASQALDMAEGTPAAGQSHWALAVVLYEMNDLEGTELHGRLAVDLSELGGGTDSGIFARFWVALALRARGNLAEAEIQMRSGDEAARLPSASTSGQMWQAANHFWFSILIDDLAAAVKCQKRLSDLWNGRDHPGREHIPPRLLIAQGKKAAAAEQLKSVYEKAVRANAQGQVIAVRAYQAMAAQTDGEAATFLSEALNLGQSEGFIRTFVDEGKMLKPLLQQCLARGVTPEYTATLIGIIEAEERQRQARNGIVARRSPSGILSERELEILRLVAAGQSNREIAAKLVIALGTAKTHVHRIFEKLNAKDRLQAITRARELKLV